MNAKPSILLILELPEIISFVKDTFKKVDEAVANKTPIFVSLGRPKPDNL
jgi:hypothetical protein